MSKGVFSASFSVLQIVRLGGSSVSVLHTLSPFLPPSGQPNKVAGTLAAVYYFSQSATLVADLGINMQ